MRSDVGGDVALATWPLAAEAFIGRQVNGLDQGGRVVPSSLHPLHVDIVVLVQVQWWRRGGSTSGKRRRSLAGASNNISPRATRPTKVLASPLKQRLCLCQAERFREDQRRTTIRIV